ncbi:MAG: CU044_5270 family protein [Dehalococcoidales bacterium]|nr:CU044_5270 family protein [Dehalococcoidales bacterium]
MRGQRDGHIKEMLAECAAEAIPEDINLWPAIAGRLQPSGHRQGPLSGMRSLLSRPPTWPMVMRSGAVVVVLALLVTVGGPLGNQGQPSASAAPLLTGLAEVAAGQPAPAAGAENGYRYLKSEEMYLACTAGAGPEPASMLCATDPKGREIWIAPDGSGRIREAAGERTFLSEGDRSAWAAAGLPTSASTTSQDFGPGELMYEDFAGLPTDPSALAAVIRQRAEQADPPVDVEMFVVVGDLLRQPGVPPEVRSALYKVAASIPGVELVGDMVDRAGRQGVAVAKTTDYWGAKERLVLIFDPATSALLGEEQVLLERADWTDATPPVVIGYATYLESSLVESLP